MEKIKNLEANLRVWESLVDTSIYFTLAGLKSKGYPEEKAWQILRHLWKNSSQEHCRADLEIIKRLYARRNKNK